MVIFPLERKYPQCDDHPLCSCTPIFSFRKMDPQYHMMITLCVESQYLQSIVLWVLLSNVILTFSVGLPVFSTRVSSFFFFNRFPLCVSFIHSLPMYPPISYDSSPSFIQYAFPPTSRVPSVGCYCQV